MPLHETSIAVKKSWSIPTSEAQQILAALELAASWDKVSFYYDLKKQASQGTAEFHNISLSQRDAWRILDAVELDSSKPPISIKKQLENWLC